MLERFYLFSIFRQKERKKEKSANFVLDSTFPRIKMLCTALANEKEKKRKSQAALNPVTWEVKRLLIRPTRSGNWGLRKSRASLSNLGYRTTCYTRLKLH